MSSQITTSSTGVATGVPDVVVVELGTQSVAADVQVALDSARDGLDAMRAALLDAGVAEQDLRTTQTSTWTGDYDGLSKTTASLTLRATLREAASAGQVVRSALAAGGAVARLNSLGFAISDPSRLESAARDAAFRQALEKAEQYAALAGRTLGQVDSLIEGEAGLRGGASAKAVAVLADAAPGLAVDGGTEDVSAAVTVTWALV